MKKLTLVAAALALLCLAGMAQANITIDTVTVGDVGNTPDSTTYGAVSYNYNIGKYEVTAEQYTAFLNAVAKSDTHGLYNPYMDLSYIPDPEATENYGDGCNILRSSDVNGYSYSVASDYANAPVNYVSYWDSCRFANWLGNGQGTGSTETGAYTLDGYTGIDGRTIARNAGATWAVTSEDEWYKAAYYGPNKDGGAGYWLYPTSSDGAPGQDMADVSGNNANYYTAPRAWPIDSDTYYTTVVGQFQNSISPYGTFDQGGNVWEWTESVDPLREVGDVANRVLRGGSYYEEDVDGWLQASNHLYWGPYGEDGTIGFRVSEVSSAVPEPASLLAAVGILGPAGLMFRRRRA